MRKNNRYLYKRMRSFFGRLFRKNKTQKNANKTVFENVAPFLNRAPMPVPIRNSLSNRKSSDFSMSNSKSDKRSGSYNRLVRPNEGTDSKIHRIESYKRKGLRVKTGGSTKKCEKINKEITKINKQAQEKIKKITLKNPECFTYEIPVKLRSENAYEVAQEVPETPYAEVGSRKEHTYAEVGPPNLPPSRRKKSKSKSKTRSKARSKSSSLYRNQPSYSAPKLKSTEYLSIEE